MIVRWFRMSVTMLPLAALAGVAGCGGQFDSKVSGVVTLDGKVVPRGTVAYQSVTGGPAAYALIEENGAYVVRTGREKGMPSGEYAVTVTANEPAASRQTDKGGPPPPGKSITPMWYRSTDTSGLRFTVTPGKNEINLELTTQPPAGWNPRGRR